MMNNKIQDYRLSDKCQPFYNVVIKKSQLGAILDRARNSISGNHFPRLSQKSHPQHRPFREIYNKRCAYCGLQQERTGSTEFEVDHYLSIASKKLSRESINNVKNLVYSCNICNQGKKEITIVDEYSNIIHPDSGNICKVFFREKNYGISITKEYEADPFILEIYTKIRFNSPIRQIDYLICQLYPLRRKHPKIYAAYEMLKDKRNEERELLR